MPLFLFLSFLFRITFIITTLADSDRCGTAGPYLKSGGAFADSILLNTMNGIVGASSHYSATSFSWQLIVPYCISKLLFPQQGFVNPHDVECHRAVAIGSGPNAGRVWLVQGTGSLNATELLDSNSKTLPSANGVAGSVILSGAFSTIKCGAIKLLVSVNSVYQIVSFMDNTWTVLFSFPTQITNTLSSYTMLTPGATYVAPLQTIALSDMTFHQAAGNDLFVWGNSGGASATLFYSPDGGSTFLLVKALTSTTISYFTSSPDGSFVFLASDNTEYFGNLGTTSIVPVTNARTAATGSRYIPYFDHQYNLHELLATQSSNTFSTAVATDLVSQDPNSVLEFNAFSNGLACPYSRMVFVVPTDDHAIQNTDTGIDVLESLPSKIYLDYKETYSFSIRMMPSPEITNTETVKLGFRLSNTDAVKMSYTRHVESDGEIVYTVKLTDLGVQGQSYPGVNLKGTILVISPAGGNFACKNLVGRRWKTKVSQWISIHSGCAPHQSIEFVAGSDSSSSSVVSSAHGTVTTTTTSSSSTTTELCPDPDPSVPCMWYDDAYPIKFSIYNALTHKYTPFNWTYQLEIVGGGLSNSDIKMFTSDQVARFNPNTGGTQKNLIWSDSSPSEITWLCQMGSPCYGILPSATNSTTSNYYIVFHVSTKSDAFATDSHSYCILETDFHVRLYGIPESFEASLAVTFGSMAVVLLVALGIVWVEWWFSEERERKRKVYPVVSPSSEETLLGQQGGGGGGEEGDDTTRLISTDEKSSPPPFQRTKKVRLQGYKGPEKEQKEPTPIPMAASATRRGNRGFFEFLRRRNNGRVANVDREVVGQDVTVRDIKPVANAVGSFAKKRESVVQSVAVARRSTVSKTAVLMEEHLRESMELLDALREEKRKRVNSEKYEDDDGQKEHQME